MLRILGILGLLALVAGCASIDAVDYSKRADVGDGVSVEPQVPWARVKLPSTDVFWTVDGIGLNELHFHMGIVPGKPLFPVSGLRKAEIGLYDAGMLPNDIQDLVASTMVKSGYRNVQASHLAPCPFGTLSGFCFDLAFATSDGLEMKGKVLAAKRDGRLELLMFLAPSEYYFAALAPTVDRVFSSVQAN